MYVRGDLDSVVYSAGAIFHEVMRPSAVSSAHKVGEDKFCVSINSNPGPNVSPSFLFLFGADVFGLGSHEAPYLIRLHPANLEVADMAVVILSTGGSKVIQQLNNRVLGSARHSRGRTD